MKEINSDENQSKVASADENSLINKNIEASSFSGSETDEALRSSKQLFENLIENISGVYWVNNLNTGKTLYISPSYETIFGRSCDDMMKNPQDFLEAIHPEDKDWLYKACLNLSKIKSGNFTYRIIRPDHVVRWISTKISVVTDDRGIMMEYGYAEDVTEMKNANEQILYLNKALEQKVKERTAELEATNRELEMFSYSVSHDLQTPLRSITGFSQLLLMNYKDKLDEKGQSYLHTIAEGAKSMHQMIHGLLQFAKLGKAAINKLEIHMEQIAGSVTEELKMNEQYHKTKFVVNPLPKAYADSELIKQVWTNLIDNAAKYSSKSSAPVVEVGAIKQNDTDVFYVRDNGVGFDMKFAPKLFNVFKRLHGIEEFDGSGLGLANVQRIISRHGGKVWAEAEKGKGASFYFTVGN